MNWGSISGILARYFRKVVTWLRPYRRDALENVIGSSLSRDAVHLTLRVMKESPMATTKIETSTTRHGILPGVFHLAIDVADKSQSTAIAVLQDARIELRTVIDHGIELAEKFTAAAFRFTRKAVQRVDEATNETLGSAERVLGSAVKSARETTNAAAQLATTAVSGVTATA
jgi:hypothetical protein